FGGAINLVQIQKNKRTPGVDKRLVLIKPTKKGHEEKQVIGREKQVAKLLNVNIKIVEERIEILTRRDKIGRTGVFLERKLTPDENIETVWNQISRNNPEISKRYP
ncbi:hypothetical protein AKJ49_01110, partial [candidate division MSBL1 archaeon SCGC-AAA382A03]